MRKFNDIDIEWEDIERIIKENFNNGQAICDVLEHELDKLYYGKTSQCRNCGKKIYFSDFMSHWIHCDDDDIFCDHDSNFDPDITIDNVNKIAVAT